MIDRIRFANLAASLLFFLIVSSKGSRKFLFNFNLYTSAISLLRKISYIQSIHLIFLNLSSEKKKPSNVKN